MNELNSFSALQRMKNRLGLNIDRVNVSSSYMVTNRIKRELEAITKEQYWVIRGNVYEDSTRITRAEMINRAITRVNKFDSVSLNYILERIQEDGIVRAINLFYIPFPKVRALANKNGEVPVF